VPTTDSPWPVSVDRTKSVRHRAASFVYEEERMRKWTRVDGDSSIHGGGVFDPESYTLDAAMIARPGNMA
jgi:hypothetical protein